MRGLYIDWNWCQNLNYRFHFVQTPLFSNYIWQMWGCCAGNQVFPPRQSWKIRDFLFEREDQIIPVEAKAELHTRAKSYRQYCKKYKPHTGFKFSMKNVGDHIVEETLTYSVPLYLIWRVKDYL